MKKKETKTMTIAEVTTNLAELREKMRTIKFGMAGGRSKNVKEQGNIRRDIARMETMKTALTKAQ